jgi:hypothetical protein
MPRGKITKDELKTFIFKLKVQLNNSHHDNYHSKELANSYLGKVLDKLDEFRE